ncbi:MAG: endoribonuclease MazF [Geothermobacteraceae bacterium]
MSYIPDRGDVVWLQFNPQAGHEQAGHRLALVLSPKRYNKITHLMLCCPLTTSVKGYPFEVRTNINNKDGVILADQIKSLDWVARKARKEARVDKSVVEEVLARVEVLLW